MHEVVGEVPVEAVSRSRYVTLGRNKRRKTSALIDYPPTLSDQSEV